MSRSLSITIIPFFFIGNHSLWQGNSTAIGYAIASYPLGSLIFSMLVGRQYDAYAPKKVLQLTVIGVILANLLIIYAIRMEDQYIFFFGLFLTGLGESTAVVSKAIVCSISEQSKKIFNLATLEIGAGSGWLIGPLLGAMTYEFSFIHQVLRGLPYFILLIFYLCLMVVIVKVAIPMTANKHQDIKSSQKPKSMMKIWLPLLIWCLYIFGTEIFTHLLTVFMIQQKSIDLVKIGTIVSYMGMIYVLLSIFVVITKIIALKVPSQVLIFSHLTLFIASILLIWKREHTVYISVALFAIGQVFAMPAGIALLESQVVSEHRGLIIGFASTFMALSILCVGLFVAPLMSIELSLPFKISGGLFLLSSCLSLVCTIINHSK
ncbi:transporter of the major facilitator superfamily (MFS) [Legionella parisiensis]|nr:transporter of the major facilitator superfamily (MFS) [Legionella parisiensis]STX76275.1 transporter of the major facilitator superfamily (MFS) [Legionella parisiensis]